MLGVGFGRSDWQRFRSNVLQRRALQHRAQISLKKGKRNHRCPFDEKFGILGPPVMSGFRKTKTEHYGGGPKPFSVHPGILEVVWAFRRWGNIYRKSRSSSRSNVFDRNPPNGQKLAVEGSKTYFLTKINSVILTLPRLKSYKKRVPPQKFSGRCCNGKLPQNGSTSL